MQAQQADETDPATGAQPRVTGRLASAGRATAKWVMYFAISFGLTAGFLILAHT
jgi:hypothetical protein